MFDKVVFIALFALIGTSFIEAIPIKISKPERTIVDRLNCSSLTGNMINIENTEYLEVENPCHLNATYYIVFINNKFPSSPQALKITGKYVLLKNNVFSGKRQDYYIVGQNVILDGNAFEGELQIHEVMGINVHLHNNSYRSNFLVYQIEGVTSTIDGDDVDSRYVVIGHLQGSIQSTSRKYFLKTFNIDEEIQNDMGFTRIEEYGKNEPDELLYPISLQNRAEFEREVLSNSKINRVGSPVLTLFMDLIRQSDHSYVFSS